MTEQPARPEDPRRSEIAKIALIIQKPGMRMSLVTRDVLMSDVTKLTETLEGISI